MIRPLPLILTFSLLLSSYAESNKRVSTRLIVEGFNNSRVGVQIHGKQIDGRVTGSLTSVGKNYFNSDLVGTVGKVWHPDSICDIVTGISADVSYSKSGGTNYYKNIGVCPGITVGVDRAFRRLILGGGTTFNLYEIKNLTNNQIHGTWELERRFDLSAYFLVGFEL